MKRQKVLKVNRGTGKFDSQPGLFRIGASDSIDSVGDLGFKRICYVISPTLL